MSGTKEPEYVAAEYAEGGDACMEALESNWDGILVGAVLEIVQWSGDFFSQIFGVFFYLWMQTPFLGLIPVWFKGVNARSMASDWSRVYAHGI